MISQPVDVVIVGGGPAGAAIAIALVRGLHASLSVTVLERSGYEHPRIGETLPPEARVPLASLGLWNRFLEQRHAPASGTLSVWGQDQIAENHFICNPHGNGWHLDRQRFDAMLASAAEEAGATLHRGARMTACKAGASGDWTIEYVCGERPGQLRARFLVDATGRACTVARRQGAIRRRCDRLTGVVGFFEAFEPDSDYRTLVEATAEGWWYSARLPGARMAVAFMTDADLLPPHQPQLRAYWLGQLQATVQTRARAAGLSLEHPMQPLRWVAAGSEILQCSSGARWLATGDAALSFDPLSAQGIYQALRSGVLAAETIEAALRGENGAAAEWSIRNRHSFEGYLRTRQAYYRLERRWPDSAFWHRRH